MSRYSVWLCLACAVLLLMSGRAAANGNIGAIGVSVSDLGNPYFVEIAKGVEEKAREIAGDDVQVYVESSAYDLQRQIRQVDSFIDRGVDMIILSAADAVAIEPAVRRAQRAGIKVIAVDVDARGADATVTTDNHQAGEIACRYMVKRLGGRGKVAIINGPPVTAAIDRVAGCEEVLSRYPHVKLLSDRQNGGGSQQGGLEKMTDLLTAYPDIDAVFAINDPTSMGAELAARQARRDDFFIVSVDAAPRVQKRLERGDTLIAGSSAQYPDRMAHRAVEIGARLIRGERVQPRVIRIPARFITSANVDSYAGWGGSAPTLQPGD